MNKTHQGRIARAVSHELGVSYSEALRRVRACAGRGMLPARLSDVDAAVAAVVGADGRPAPSGRSKSASRVQFGRGADGAPVWLELDPSSLNLPPLTLLAGWSGAGKTVLAGVVASAHPGPVLRVGLKGSAGGGLVNGVVPQELTTGDGDLDPLGYASPGDAADLLVRHLGRDLYEHAQAEMRSQLLDGYAAGVDCSYQALAFLERDILTAVRRTLGADPDLWALVSERPVRKIELTGATTLTSRTRGGGAALLDVALTLATRGTLLVLEDVDTLVRDEYGVTSPEEVAALTRMSREVRARGVHVLATTQSPRAVEELGLPWAQVVVLERQFPHEAAACSRLLGGGELEELGGTDSGRRAWFRNVGGEVQVVTIEHVSS